MKILSLNVWNDNRAQKQRYTAILDLCKTHNPDLICFQEATYNLVKILWKDDSLREEYEWSDDGTGSSLGTYGVLTLCRRGLSPTYTFHPFESYMERQLLQCSFTHGEDTISIGNVHLESLSYHKLRVAQLDLCDKILSVHSNAILVGDFNFCSYRNYRESEAALENDSLKIALPGWIDIWPTLKDTVVEKGYTFDTDVNLMLVGKAHEQMRYDRVCCKLSTWKPVDIRLIGNEEVHTHDTSVEVGKEAAESKSSDSMIAGRTKLKLKLDLHAPPKHIFISDHFGLLSTFEIV